jgi:hypothetical protein
MTLRERRQARDGGLAGKVDEINCTAVRVAWRSPEADALVAVPLTWA